LFKGINRFYHPQYFQGVGKTKNYFEGWYFKLVAKDGKHAFAVIPGVSMDATGKQIAFIQILDGKNLKAYYESFDFDLFSFSESKFEIKIGENVFSEHSIHLNLPQLKGELSFGQFHKWPSSLLSPGVMGWYSFMPFMECYHAVVSLHHGLSGVLSYFDESISFDSGNGYIEKDWGRSFPKSWVWTQCNNYDFIEPISVMISVAYIPWLKNHFIGYLGAIQIGENLHSFTTYNGAKLKLSIENNCVHIKLSNKGKVLILKAIQNPGADLFSPIQGAMAGKVNESLMATHELEFFIDGLKIIESKGHSAGLEIAGPVEILLEGIL
jgi:hypothetical protein